MNHHGLLPSLCWNGDRWWLPLSTRTASGLAQAMITSRTAAAVGQAIAVIEDLLARDPAFFVWSALKTSQPCAAINTRELAAEVNRGLIEQFAPGNAYLQAPPQTAPFCQAWRELSTQPPSLCNALQWLEVTGPCVPNAWRRQWPTIQQSQIPHASDPRGINDYGCNPLDLSLLARQQDRISDLETSFAKTLHDEKLAALKELAYGLSHEINNPLANISTRAQTLLRDEPQADRKRFLNAIVAQAMRAYELIADMMYFANPPQPHLETVDFSALTAKVAQEFEPQWLPKAIALTHQIDTEIAAHIDPAQFADAIRSLLRNSTEAIGNQGQIDMRLRKRGNNVVLRIADNGAGLNAKESRHAFDPFFSGREAGRGLGLGLCKAKRVAKLHGGDVSLRSGPVGTIATIWFPAESR